MARNNSILITFALAACVVYLLAPAQETFLVPTLRGSAGSAQFAQGSSLESRTVEVARAAQTQSENQGITSPRKINLLFIALLAGTAAIGLLALFFYGSYSGTGSSV
eukprot:CAMPEP_0177190084 /NCGR_PEP_ID=MMETSP0367-20130122/20622_1 /TAXON_ID=447022 ORGANISM="Scrippsiella hangoei-like, Strain SHHI-4" /NCGR_SAMPLE_ID=MMETSP0367 /ASSEMBLY_ACC=CAM_ASM_000362 /LENGTH=106 /DNA_ID=CAMNT_0018637683 /DNA_START=75 /DNA_END=395 /DNA_ORIENTATION=+